MSGVARGIADRAFSAFNQVQRLQVIKLSGQANGIQAGQVASSRLALALPQEDVPQEFGGRVCQVVEKRERAIIRL